MDQNGLSSELQSLERKLRMLIVEHDSLKREIHKVKSENLELKSLLSLKDKQINDFQNNNKITTIVDTISTGEKESAEIKEKIDIYIKEIDKCIQYLSE